MSTWLPVIFQSLTLIGIFAILIALLRKNSQKDDSLSTTQILETSKRTESSVALLTAKQEAFASNSTQSLSTLRTELSNTLSSQSSDLRQEVVKAIASLGDQTRLTLEALRKSITERQDQLTLELGKGQTTLLETINTRLSEFQMGMSERFNGFQKAQSDLGQSQRETIENTLSRMGRDLRDAVAELKTEVKERLDAVALQTTALVKTADEQQTSLRTTVEQRLDKLNESNAKKLDEMRETVDEKLHKTLETRLTQSFGLVTDQLGKVQTGLGEMKELAVNVGDLKRVLNNVSTRGTFGEVQLGAQLEQVLAPNQFARNVRIRPNTDERVDFVIRLPYGDDEPVLLPIDSKFPKEDWERLEDAALLGDAQGVEVARKELGKWIKQEAKNIAEKYIYPPATTNFAFMYLPTEGLFSEALRIPGLADELQLKYRISLAGPTNFMAILNSLQMGFRTLAIQKKSSEVWQLLSVTKVEFQNFGALMSTVEKQVGTVQNTIRKVNSKTKTINRQLKDVEVLEMGTPPVGLLEVPSPQGSPGQGTPLSEEIYELVASEEVELGEDGDEND
ncbi:MAG: DNA recombination protein RmuC [Terracidiphilus sp.]|jgi:DNA recombination protein RmuC